mgnify:CR=1 FL=1
MNEVAAVTVVPLMSMLFTVPSACNCACIAAAVGAFTPSTQMSIRPALLLVTKYARIPCGRLRKIASIAPPEPV